MEKTTLGKRINSARKDQNITSEQLAERCHLNATYIRQIEGGTKTPSLPVFIDLCNALNVSPEYLLQDELTVESIYDLKELTELLSVATPNNQSLIISMLKAAIKHIKEHE